jgi:hypothetical protein
MISRLGFGASLLNYGTAGRGDQHSPYFTPCRMRQTLVHVNKERRARHEMSGGSDRAMLGIVVPGANQTAPVFLATLLQSPPFSFAAFNRMGKISWYSGDSYQD